MAVRGKRVVRKSLRKKGFDENPTGDHVFLVHSEDATIFTKVSHGAGGRDIGSPLIAKMASQCRLSKQEFLDLVDCSLTGDGYRRILQDKGFLPLDPEHEDVVEAGGGDQVDGTDSFDEGGATEVDADQSLGE